MKLRLLALLGLATLAVLFSACSNPEKDFAKAEKAHTEQAFQRFIDKHPKNPLVTQAKSRIEEVAFETAMRTDTQASLGHFIERFPSSLRIAQTRTRIEELAFEEASRSEKIDACEKFIARFPQGSLAGKATLRIEEIAYHDACRTNTPAGYEAFLQRFPESAFIQKANAALAAATFTAAKSAGSLPLLEAFLQRFPSAAQSVEAKAVIDLLRFEAAAGKASIAGWREFLADVPDSARETEAKERLTVLCFAEATKADSEQALEDFLREFGSSSRAKEAHEALGARVLLRISAKPKVVDFEKFLTRFGDTPSAPTAKGKLEELEFEEAVLANDILAYEQFLALHPDSHHLTEILSRVREVRARDWQEIEKVGDGANSALKDKKVAQLLSAVGSLKAYWSYCLKYPGNAEVEVMSGTLTTKIVIPRVDWIIKEGQIVGAEVRPRNIALYLQQDPSFRQEIEFSKALLMGIVDVAKVDSGSARLHNLTAGAEVDSMQSWEMAPSLTEPCIFSGIRGRAGAHILFRRKAALDGAPSSRGEILGVVFSDDNGKPRKPLDTLCRENPAWQPDLKWRVSVLELLEIEAWQADDEQKRAKWEVVLRQIDPAGRPDQKSRVSILERREYAALQAGDLIKWTKSTDLLRQVDPEWKSDPKSGVGILEPRWREAWLQGKFEKAALLQAWLGQVDPTWRPDIKWQVGLLEPEERAAWQAGDEEKRQKIEVALRQIEPSWQPDPKWRVSVLELRERQAWLLGDEVKREQLESQIKRIETSWVPKREGLKRVALSDRVFLFMMPVQPGTFVMGSPENETGRSKGETQHSVTLTQPFWMGKTEVTQKQWRAVMGPDPSNFKGDDLPVEMVSWKDAMAFCRKLTEQERTAGRLPQGYEYTLPTEAQWEYACRAGTTGPHAGDLDGMAWYWSTFNRSTHPVAKKKPNAWGLFDMHGNVWEWCRDWYAEYPNGAVTDPLGPASGSNRVQRGGGWFNGDAGCRSAFRSGGDPGYGGGGLGFRLALSSVR